MEIGSNVFIADSVKIPDDIVIGDNSKIYDGTVLASNVLIGHNTTIGKLVNFESGVTIGDHVTIYSQSHLTTGIEINNYVWLGPMFLGLNTKRIRHVRDIPLIIEPPRIEFGARIGARVTLMPGITVGNEAMVDSCSVVTKNVNDFEIVRGFPARPIGIVDKNERLDFAKLVSECSLCESLRCPKCGNVFVPEGVD